MMRRRTLALLGAVALANGFLSPAAGVLWRTAVVWMPGFLLAVPGMVFFLTPLVLAALTLMLSGVPAALYERLAPRPAESVTLRIWLVGAVLLTLPAARAVFASAFA
ncbi:hypothetical protein [Azospirillum halopraeferens]|uniref:hypothetical protein n=1 Tax=Azospirillum halopraeferens TaxID=34010 RepID=UPI00048D22D2|nr:hypothetical protein [Azospirillum halopraeferens]